MRSLSFLMTICCAGLVPTQAAQKLDRATRREGDAALRRAVEAVTRQIYDSASTPVFLLISSSPPGLRNCRNAEITGSYIGG